MKKLFRSMLFVAIICLVPLTSFADTLNHFHFVVGEGGNLEFNNNVLTGTNLGVTQLNLTTVGGVDSTYAVDALLNFTANLISIPGSGFKVGSGGSLTINGSIAGLGISNSNLLTALSGFDNILIQSQKTALQISDVDLNSNIDTFFNLPTDSIYDNSIFTLSFKNMTTNSSGVWFALPTGESVDGRHAPVPIPAAAWLFLSGIAGIAGLRRKNKK